MISEIYGLVEKSLRKSSRFLKNWQEHALLPVLLSCRFQHIFNENSIPGIGVVDEHMGHCAYQLSVLDDRSAAYR